MLPDKLAAAAGDRATYVGCIPRDIVGIIAQYCRDTYDPVEFQAEHQSLLAALTAKHARGDPTLSYAAWRLDPIRRDQLLWEESQTDAKFNWWAELRATNDPTVRDLIERIHGEDWWLRFDDWYSGRSSRGEPKRQVKCAPHSFCFADVTDIIYSQADMMWMHRSLYDVVNTPQGLYDPWEAYYEWRTQPNYINQLVWEAKAAAGNYEWWYTLQIGCRCDNDSTVKDLARRLNGLLWWHKFERYRDERSSRPRN